MEAHPLRVVLQVHRIGGFIYTQGLVAFALQVGGMMCEGCTSRVTEVLKSAPNVTRVEVRWESSPLFDGLWGHAQQHERWAWVFLPLQSTHKWMWKGCS